MSQKDKNWKQRDIFRILNKDEIWIAAYEKLKGNGGAETLGSLTETMDGMSLERLKGLQYRVCTETYKFKPVKLIYIPAKKGKKRPLGLSTANDKIVQEVMRMILEAIYEPVFSSESFGFRTGLGCHDALAHVENKFRWVDHVIEKGIADPDRLGIAGLSYGGYMSCWSIGQTDRFKAAVVGGAITDVAGCIRTTDVPELVMLNPDPGKSSSTCLWREATSAVTSTV